jgi:hypothetical protein
MSVSFLFSFFFLACTKFPYCRCPSCSPRWVYDAWEKKWKRLCFISYLHFLHLVVVGGWVSLFDFIYLLVLVSGSTADPGK